MMHSLISLPQELVEMIFGYLSLSDRGKVRMLSKDYNSRFQVAFWYSARVRINLTIQCLERLVKTIEQCDSTIPIENILITQARCWQKHSPSRIVPLLVKAFSALQLRTIEFQLPTYKSVGFEYWKPVIDAITEANQTTIEVINSPPVQLSNFALSKKRAKLYQDTFRNLRELRITTTSSSQHERPDLTQRFWSFIETIGENLESLKITAVHKPQGYYSKPDPHRGKRTRQPDGGYLPEKLSLPKLRSLRLNDVAVTVNDLKKLLKSADTMESFVINGCQMDDPKNDWFEVLKYLKANRFRKLQRLVLLLSGNYWGVSNSYDLPELRVDSYRGNWISGNCLVQLRSGANGYRQMRKNLWEELEGHDEADGFWSSITNQKWTGEKAVAWKTPKATNNR
ncbi:hypothetical protein TWF281_010158 [Arthrobotrys megalospora]